MPDMQHVFIQIRRWFIYDEIWLLQQVLYSVGWRARRKMEIRLETKQMKLNKQTLKRIIKEELEAIMNESDRFQGQIPQELWSISDYEDARDEGMLSRLSSYSDEELQMKIEQLKEEIAEEDPYDNYDSTIAPKEALINFIQDILQGR